MATYDADFSDSLSFGEDEVGHESHLYFNDVFSFSDVYGVNEEHFYSNDSFGFSEDYRVNEQPTRFSDNFNFNESLAGESAGSHSFSNTISFSESRRASLDVQRRSDSISFFEFPFAQSTGEDAILSQSLVFTELYSATKTIAPDRRILSEVLTFIESRTAQRIKTSQDFIHFLESWCILIDVQRERADAFGIIEHRLRYVNDISDLRNNPITIPIGTGFSMKGNYRKRQSDVLHFEDKFVPVDADGVPLILEPCHPSIFHHTGWSALPGWSDLVEWADLGE